MPTLVFVTVHTMGAAKVSKGRPQSPLVVPAGTKYPLKAARQTRISLLREATRALRSPQFAIVARGVLSLTGLPSALHPPLAAGRLRPLDLRTASPN